MVEGNDCEQWGLKYKTDTKVKSHMIHQPNLKSCHMCEVFLSGLDELKKHLDHHNLCSYCNQRIVVPKSNRDLTEEKADLPF